LSIHDKYVKSFMPLLENREIATEFYTDDHKNRIDIALTKRHIAIEIQLSNITIKETEKRTSQLNHSGWHVLWLLCPYSFPLKDGLERQVKSIEKFLHGTYFGRVYYFNPYPSPIVIPAHFERVETQYYTVETPWGDEYTTTDPDSFDGISAGSPGWDSYESYTYYHKRTRCIIQGPEIDKINFIKTTSTNFKTEKNYKIARLNDKKFW